MENLTLRRRTTLLLAGAIVCSWYPAWAEASPAGKHVRLLAVGNSFSGNATRFLPDIVAASKGNRLTFGHAYIGGCSLEKHVLLARAFEKDPRDPAGRPYSGKTSSLREMLEKEKWDYVTMQQVSIKSFDPDSYRPWAKELYDSIKRYAPQAEVLIHQTWAYRDDDVLFRSGASSADTMHRGLSEAYATIARELACRVIPVGDAFHAARRLPAWRFKGSLNVDARAYPYPQTPEQGKTLHRGWHWTARDGVRRLAADTHHAGVAGEYLGACVWFEFLFEQSVEGNTFVPPGLAAGDARSLQEVAHRVVSEGTGWQKPVPTQ